MRRYIRDTRYDTDWILTDTTDNWIQHDTVRDTARYLGEKGWREG